MSLSSVDSRGVGEANDQYPKEVVDPSTVCLSFFLCWVELMNRYHIVHALLFVYPQYSPISDRLSLFCFKWRSNGKLIRWSRAINQKREHTRREKHKYTGHTIHPFDTAPHRSPNPVASIVNRQHHATPPDRHGVFAYAPKTVIPGHIIINCWSRQIRPLTQSL